MRNVLSSHLAKIGRRGGQASTPAKTLAARLNARKRWHPNETQVLPIELLRDGVWYRGQGRNASVGLWDAQARCFWTVALNDFADPARFPAKAKRQVRLKREEYFWDSEGTFKPIAEVA